jgi:hypothetical protein
MEELRRRALEQETEVESYETVLARDVRSDKMFGMTAAERMFVSVGCFLATSLAGFVLLLALDKIALP